VLTSADDGKTIELKLGDTFTIKLEGNPTTGYNWYVISSDPQIVAQQGDPAFKADTMMVGSGGMVTLTFKALSPGTTTLQLGYLRSWEKDIAPLQTYSLTLIVK